MRTRKRLKATCLERVHELCHAATPAVPARIDARRRANGFDNQLVATKTLASHPVTIFH